MADFNIIFHMSYENALERSITIVENFQPENELQARAQIEVLESFKSSLHKIQTTPLDEVDDAYTRFRGDDGKFINGIKMHTETNKLHLFGLFHAKRVITPGIYKPVNSRPLTIEKKKIQKLCPVSKFRQFRVDPLQVEKIAVQHISLLPPEDPDLEIED